MTYSTHQAPAHAGTALRTIADSLGRGFTTFFAALGRLIEANSTGQARFDRVQRLQAKTDAELKTLGIRRDDIVHHVFRDLYYC